MFHALRFLVSAALLALPVACASAGKTPAATATPPAYDAALAERLGADDLGMRSYVLAILKTGPQDAAITDKDQRAELFAGHFSNMGRLAEDGKLVLAGPLGGEDGRRGLFILNTAYIATAQEWVASDPTIEAGIFTVDYSKYYGSAALMQVNEVHAKIQKKGIGE
ncbi:YCII domain-containing protein [Hyphomonas polymorpha PS728]|uniref:YCII domain-containing protein n=1 Tax=Hyphomonas polymorpha PS728 TaxID=1280954 RepID=A0A062VLY0_9PROT|nr:YciI family protein [Hyphomonas polymorpha]KDA00682.1 YCII domain-containing protein [Hyphomonas polymorpha PS728]